MHMHLESDLNCCVCVYVYDLFYETKTILFMCSLPFFFVYYLCNEGR